MKQNKIRNNQIERGVKAMEDIHMLMYTQNKIVFDFSTKTAFCSCHTNQFNNYLTGEHDFVEKFREIIADINKLSEHTPEELIRGGNAYRHCHVVEYRSVAEILHNMYSKLGCENVFEQELGDETFFQFGFEHSIRLIGTLHGNIFRIYIVDYYHSFNNDERKNQRNLRNFKYSIK